jgi:hypothetical protein
VAGSEGRQSAQHGHAAGTPQARHPLARSNPFSASTTNIPGG